MPPKMVACSKEIAREALPLSKKRTSVRVWAHSQQAAGLIPGSAPRRWSSRCHSTCEGGDARRTTAVAARRARSHGRERHQWP